MSKYNTEWLRAVNNKPKLRFYKQFKNEYETEGYIKCNVLNKKQRSILSKLRCGILPI